MSTVASAPEAFAGIWCGTVFQQYAWRNNNLPNYHILRIWRSSSLYHVPFWKRLRRRQIISWIIYLSYFDLYSIAVKCGERMVYFHTTMASGRIIIDIVIMYRDGCFFCIVVLPPWSVVSENSGEVGRRRAIEKYLNSASGTSVFFLFGALLSP